MDDDSKATLERHLMAEENHDAAAAAACYGRDGWYEHEALGLRFDGPASVEAQYALSYAAFPDLAFAVEDEIEGPDSFVQRGRFRGTFSGALLGVEPTGRFVDIPMSSFYVFRDGLIRSERISLDLASFAEHTGVELTDWQDAAGMDTAAVRAWKAVTRYADAKSRADVTAALAECTTDFELCTVPFGITSQGIADSRAGLDLWFTAFPDYHVTVAGHLASGRTVTCWGTIRATMSGDLGPLRLTGRSYSLPFSCIFAIEEGQIRREDFHFDLAQMATQLGLDIHATQLLLGLTVEVPG